MDRIVSIDPGLKGGITTDNGIYKMPLLKILVKEARKVFIIKNNKKVMNLSGKHKGEYKMRIKKPAEYKEELDLNKLLEYFKGHDVLVIEKQGFRPGESPKSAATASFNIGQIHAVAKICGLKVIEVSSQRWKKDLKIDKKSLSLSGDPKEIQKRLKVEAVNLAEKLSGLSFRTERGALRDGEAESYLIGVWYGRIDF